MSCRSTLLFLPCLACGGGGVSTADVLETYADLAFASYGDAASQAAALQDALEAMVAAPDASTYAAAQQAWLAAREPYGQTEAFRFYGGPIDDEETGVEGWLNPWPLDELYIDYVEGAPEAGIINDVEGVPVIDTAALLALNTPDTPTGGEKAISTGYHAVEFLLWGQDFYDDGPGRRAYTDYLTDGGASAPNPDRRGDYLRVAGQLLVDQLATVHGAWDPADAQGYRAGFVALDAPEGLRRILTGLGALSGAELAGERLQVAYDTQEQEDEHSCFSDNTHRDVVTDALGIRNVYLGSFTASDGGVVSGPSLSDLVAAQDPDLDARMRALLDDSVAAAEALPPPFDQAIRGDNPDGRAAVAAVIAALRAQTSGLVEVATLLDITLNLEE